MLKAIEHLVEAAKMGRISRTEGNHSFKRRNDLWYFKHHQSNICVVDPKRYLVAYNDGGYQTKSTTRAINAYKKFFDWYRIVDVQVVEGKEELQEEEECQS